MSDILIGAIVFGLVFGAAIFGMFLDSQPTNYDSRNDLRFAHHLQHPVQKQGRPVPNRRLGGAVGKRMPEDRHPMSDIRLLVIVHSARLRM
jgi:hypothetical protein